MRGLKIETCEVLVFATLSLHVAATTADAAAAPVDSTARVGIIGISGATAVCTATAIAVHEATIVSVSGCQA